MQSFFGWQGEGKKKKKNRKKKKGKNSEEEAPSEGKAGEGASADPQAGLPVGPSLEGAHEGEGEFGEAKREELKKKLLANEMTPEEMDALFGNFEEDEEELDEEAAKELAMFSARLGLGGGV